MSARGCCSTSWRTEVLSLAHSAPTNASQADMATRYADYFPLYVKAGIEAELLDPDLPLRPEETCCPHQAGTRSRVSVLGLQTLYDRYSFTPKAIASNCRRRSSCASRWACDPGDRPRSPRHEFLRPAVVVRFHGVDSDAVQCGHAAAATVILLPTTVADDLDGIFKSVKDNALLAKYSGGLGNDWSRVRASARTSRAPMAKARAWCRFSKWPTMPPSPSIRAASARAQSALSRDLAYRHRGILDCARTPATTRRTHDMNTANWVPDLFMQRVEADGSGPVLAGRDARSARSLRQGICRALRLLRGQGCCAAKSACSSRSAPRICGARC